MLQTLAWTGSSLRLLDQTKLPTQTVYVDITDEKQMHDAIKRLVVRGAPAIAWRRRSGLPRRARCAGRGGPCRLQQVCQYLATARPTAVNLFWAIDRVKRGERRGRRKQPSSAFSPKHWRCWKKTIASAARSASNGAKLLARFQKGGAAINLLTHCNAGGLATVQYGTALAPVYIGKELGMKFHVYADETRPLLQGSRITAFELEHNGVPVTVICDNMAATVMQEGKVAAVIVGPIASRLTAMWPTKIGTLNVAILARHFGIPFYVAAPTSSIDMSLATGAQIPIEQRDPSEVSHGMGKQTAPPKWIFTTRPLTSRPRALVSAIITEKGVIEPPYEASLKRIMK